MGNSLRLWTGFETGRRKIAVRVDALGDAYCSMAGRGSTNASAFAQAYKVGGLVAPTERRAACQGSAHGGVSLGTDAAGPRILETRLVCGKTKSCMGLIYTVLYMTSAKRYMQCFML